MPCYCEEENIEQRCHSSHHVEVCVNMLHVRNDSLNVNIEKVDVYEKSRNAN
jgi:hypothetical protein